MSYICKNPWTTLFIWGNGNVTHCCYSNIGSLGNIRRNSLMEIWSGEKINFVRENISRGDYLKAGCEYFCRSYRWNQFYGSVDLAAEIPEGLGRLEELSTSWAADGPKILGFGIDWSCNLKCRHCLSSREGKGVSKADFVALRPHMETARFLRFMGGEFSINRECLEILRYISDLDRQPTVFFSTNGQTSIGGLAEYCGRLKGLHLKFSLEGLGDNYENVRIGGAWKVFEKNLDEAVTLFSDKRRQGLDWRIYLNFCVMRSNFLQIPSIIGYAIKKDIPLVLNTINGMRHIEENMFMYSAACPSAEEIETTGEQCREVLAAANGYCFKKELAAHLDYILKCARARKLGLPQWFLKVWSDVFKGRFADWSLYAAYRISMDAIPFFLYAARKIKNRIQRGVS